MEDGKLDELEARAAEDEEDEEVVELAACIPTMSARRIDIKQIH